MSPNDRDHLKRHILAAFINCFARFRAQYKNSDLRPLGRRLSYIYLYSLWGCDRR